MRTKYSIKKEYPNAKFGSSRAFIPMGDVGLKIPYNARGVAETEKEKEMLFHDWNIANYSHIFPKGIEETEEGYIVECLSPITTKLFKEIVGLGLREVMDFFESEQQRKTTGKGWLGDDTKFWENEWCYDLWTCLADYGLPFGDVRKANLATDGKNVKIIDFVYLPNLIV